MASSCGKIYYGGTEVTELHGENKLNRKEKAQGPQGEGVPLCATILVIL